MSDAGEMTLTQKRAAARRALDWCGRNVGEWAVRDTLVKFTEWGDWKGGVMLSIDEETARRVVAFLKRELKEWGDQAWCVDGIYGPLAHYARLADAQRRRR